LNLSEFLILFFIGTLLLIFWILPIIISSLTNISYKSLLFELSNALIISAATTLSVVALPFIRTATANLLGAKKIKENETEMEDIIKTINSIGYPFAQLGNFFIYIFILFALLYFNHPIDHFHYIVLPFIAFFSSIGSPSTSIDAVSLLSNWLGLPVTNTTNLYIGLLPLIRYTQVLASVMGFAFLSILISFALFDSLRVNYKRVIAHLVSAFCLVTLLVLSLNNFFPSPGEKSFERLNRFTISPQLVKNVKVTFLPPFNEAEASPVKNKGDSLSRIQKSGILRVGYNADMRPFVFFNTHGQLVGYDVEYAYALADTLNANIEFIPFTWNYLVSDFDADKFDIAIGAIYVTEKRLESVNFTQPYFRSPISVIVPKRNERKFQDVEQMNKIKNLRIGVFDDPVLIPLIRKNLPNAKIVILPSVSGEAPLHAFENNEIDAVVWSQAQTEVWAWAHPDYVSITPTGLAAPFLMAYMIQRDSPQLLYFLNYWLELKKNDGFKQRMYNQWILSLP
jgi:ABC-type amino acid transport substrate-binding protein